MSESATLCGKERLRADQRLSRMNVKERLRVEAKERPAEDGYVHSEASSFPSFDAIAHCLHGGRGNNAMFEYCQVCIKRISPC